MEQHFWFLNSTRGEKGCCSASQSRCLKYPHFKKSSCSSRLRGVVSARLCASRTLIRSRTELRSQDPAIDNTAKPEPAEMIFTIGFLTSC